MNSSSTDSANSAAPSAPRLEPGAVIEGRYRVIECIGAGGFATVYRAQQLLMDRDVAVKVLNGLQYAIGEFDPQEYAQRFRTEAKAAAAIKHANVVTVHDFGFSEHGPYIAMELLEGHDLGEEIRRNGPLSFHRAARLFAPCLEALGDAHESGVVHRDLKPSNLFLTRPGTKREALVLLDFGVAHLADLTSGIQDGRNTEPGVYLGTPAYLAPEWISDSFVSPGLDVYQMGLILVESLTGRKCVDAYGLYGCIAQHAAGKLDVPDWVLSSPLGAVIRTATAMRVSDRFGHGHAFAEALAAVDLSGVERRTGDEITGRHSTGTTTGRHGDATTLDTNIDVLAMSNAKNARGPDTIPVGPPSQVVELLGMSLDRAVESLPESDVGSQTVKTYAIDLPEAPVRPAFPSGPAPAAALPDVSAEPVTQEHTTVAAATQTATAVEEIFEPEKDRKRRFAVMMAALVGFLIVIAVFVYAFLTISASDGPADEDPVDAAAAATGLPAQSKVSRQGAPTGAASTASSTPGQTATDPKEFAFDEPDETISAEAPEPLLVEVRTTPPGAQILQDGELLGTSPATLSFDDDSPVELTLKLPGHRPLLLTVTPQDGLVLDRALTRDTTTSRRRTRGSKMRIAP